jgi:hypothetical protein
LRILPSLYSIGSYPDYSQGIEIGKLQIQLFQNIRATVDVLSAAAALSCLRHTKQTLVAGGAISARLPAHFKDVIVK